MAEKEIGEVIHYFGKIGVAVFKLKDSLKSGDKVKIKGHTTDFEQEISEMQSEHEAITEAKKGQEIGVKVKDHVREGDKIYKES